MHSEPFVKLQPVFKDYLWGGEKLKALFFAPQPIVAEAWLLSVHPDGESVIAEGVRRGMTLAAYLRETTGRASLPVLVKMIDARQKLSVQVHPDDAYARLHEHDNGKSELWTVLSADPGAYLYVGFTHCVTRGEVARRVADGTIEDILRKVPTHAGDTVFIPAGTVHAIGAGNLILEIQQSSNATYRLFDYQRRDAQGNLRPLHLQKALDVLQYGPYHAPAEDEPSPEAGQIAGCAYFRVFRYAIGGTFRLPVPAGSFASAVCTGGTGTLSRGGKQTALQYGDSVYLPAGGEPAEITGQLQLVVTRAAG